MFKFLNNASVNIFQTKFFSVVLINSLKGRLREAEIPKMLSCML